MQSSHDQWWFDPTRNYTDNLVHGPFGAFAKAAREIDNRGAPQETFLGHKVTTPFGIPAGPLPTARHCAAAFRNGFDVNVYKTVRSRESRSHPFPNTLAVRVDGDLESSVPVVVADQDLSGATSISNSYGVPSPDPDVWQPQMFAAAAAAGPGQLLVGSFQGTRSGDDEDALVADYARTAALVAETGVKVLEMNLSCPNEGVQSLVCFDVPLVVKIAHAVRERIGDLSVLIKIAYFPHDGLLEALVREAGTLVDGIAAINTLPARLVDAQGAQALPGQGREVAGVCGAAIRWAGLEMTRRIAQHRDTLGVPLEIIGVGGVMSASDYQAYIDAGADAVMSATGALRDPTLGKAVRALKDQELVASR